MVIKPIADIFREWFPIIPFEHGRDTIHQSVAQWYIPPEQHVIEFVVLNLIFLPMSFYFIQYPHTPMRPARSFFPVSFKRFDLVFGLLSLLCFLGTVLLKLTKSNPSLEIFFLLQP